MYRLFADAGEVFQIRSCNGQNAGAADNFASDFEEAHGKRILAKLFMGGAIPGIIMGLLFMVINAIICKKRGYETALKERASFGEVMKALVQVLPSLALPVITMGGILMGVFTATEGGAFAAGYALLLGIIYKEITLKKFIMKGISEVS